MIEIKYVIEKVHFWDLEREYKRTTKTSDVQSQPSVEIIREQYVTLLRTDEMKSYQLAFSFYEISKRYLARRLKHIHICALYHIY